MKILYVSTSTLPSESANSVHVMKMCQGFAKNGHDVTLMGIAGTTKLDPFKFYDVDEIFKVVLSKPMSGTKRFSYLVSSIHRIFGAIKERKKNYDIIYTRWLLAAYIFSKSKNKVIFEYHGEKTGKLSGYFEKKMIEKNRTTKHVFITHALRNHYLEKYPFLKNRVTVVLPDAADKKEIVTSTDRENLTCGYIGSFKEGKGVDIVVRLAEKLPGTIFHIVGGSEAEISRYKQESNSKNIIWHGFLNQEMAMEILEKEIDIALLPNKASIKTDDKNDIGSWTSPMKLFEYMSYGKAILASDLDVLKEVLMHQKNALLVNPADIDLWAENVMELQENRSLYSSISKQAKHELDTQYTWKIRANNSLKIK